jgi:predicted nucleic acid-binding protein
MGRDDVAAAAALVEQYADQAIGLADASLLVLAEHHGTQQVLTLDRRHFGVLQLPSGRPVRVLPS